MRPGRCLGSDYYGLRCVDIQYLGNRGERLRIPLRLVNEK